MPLLALARAVLAAAVATDRAGASWDEIAAILDISPNAASRHYSH